MHEEIKSLKQALEASPDNDPLKKILVQKMAQLEGYSADIINYSKDLLRKYPDDTEMKELLIVEYYKIENFSACIVIADTIKYMDRLAETTKLTLAKVYLKEGDRDKSGEIYRSIVEENQSFSDSELDEVFRLKSSNPENEDLLDNHLVLKPSINFDDVGGMQAVKKEIEMKIIKPLENAELFASYGKKIGGGILLYGPPGCGKTYIAKATAGQINAKFINIGLNDILDMWLGNSEKNLHEYFELARENTPCVLFFDEIDALGGKRTAHSNSAGKNVINQFLSELDGIESNNDGILIIGATNAPWDLDPAFKRPGRFDRLIFVPPPDETSKQEILRLKLKEKPHAEIDYKNLSAKTKDYSGADIDAIIDIAIEEVLSKAMETGKQEPIKTKDLQAAIKKHKASTVDWFSSAKNYAVFANKSGIYDEILTYLKKGKK